MGVSVWASWMDAYLEEHYADERNADLCRALGVSDRTLHRNARRLGLVKSDAFRERVKAWAKAGCERRCEYMRITGQKQKRTKVCGKPFEKGHRFSPEVEEKRVRAIRDRAWDERVRIIHGVARKTGWKMVDYSKK